VVFREDVACKHLDWVGKHDRNQRHRKGPTGGPITFCCRAAGWIPALGLARAPVPDRDGVAVSAPREREGPAAWLRHIDDRWRGTAWSHVPLDAAVDHHLGVV
jgi:hypothetical protein